MTTQNSNVIQISPMKERDEGSNLNKAVRDCLTQYFDELDGNHPGDLYDMVLQQVEGPLLEVVMAYVDGNQSKASQCLGLNRGTLRKKLRNYDLLK